MADENGRNRLPLPDKPLARGSAGLPPTGPRPSASGPMRPAPPDPEFDDRRGTTYHTRNPIHWLAFTSLGALIAGVLALGLFFLSPSSLGLLREEFIRNEVYSFQRVIVDDPYLKVDVKDGFLIPTYRSSQTAGVIIVGTGLYRLAPPPDQADSVAAALNSGTLQDSFTALYMPLTYQELEAMKDRAVAKPADAPAALDRARAVVNDLKQDLRSVGLFGITREFQSGAESQAVQLYGDHFGRVSLFIGRQVTLAFNATGRTFSFPNQYSGTAMFFLVYAQPRVLPVSALLLLLMVGFLGSMVFVLTVDTNPDFRHRSIIERELELRNWPPRATTTAAAVIALYAILAALTGAYLPGRVLGTLGDLAITALILYLFYHYKVTWKRLGLRRDNLYRSLTIGAALGFLTVSAGALSFPLGVQHLSPLGLLGQVYWSFVVIGLARTFIIHAYLQTWLQNRLGPTWGLVATAFLAGAAISLPAALILKTALAPALIENLFVIPLMTALNGFLFQRTGNAFGPALSRALMDFLPAFFRY
ncbi:MAG: hypothetical protein ACYC53_11445 [Bacillota bacterium]